MTSNVSDRAAARANLDAHGSDGARPTAAENVRGAVVPLVVGLLIGSIFVLVFLAAFHDPKPRDLPVAVVAPAQVVSAVRTQSTKNDDAFDVRSYPSEAAARTAVHDREVFGAFIVGPRGPNLLVAGGNGPSVTQTLQGAFTAAAQATGGQLTITDVEPLSAGDSRGLSVFYGAFGVVLAGFLFGLTSMQLAPRLSGATRAGSALVFSALAGLVVAWLLQPVFGALPAPFLVASEVVGLLALAVGATTTALLKVFGPAGTFIAAVVLLVFGNATSTGILPAQYLPTWLEPLTEILPVGVAVRALRGAAYFYDDGLSTGTLILAGWAVGAGLLFAVGAVVQRRRTASRAVRS